MGGIEAGKAYLKFLIDDSSLKKSLKNIGAKLKDIGKIGASVTAPLVAGFTAATAAFVSAGSALKDMSDRTGVSARALSELKFAAEQSSVSLADLENGLRQMIKKGEGGEGSVEERFMRLANEIAAIPDPAQRAARAMEAFGRSGMRLLPLLNQGADGIAAMRAEAARLGLTMDDETAASAEQLGDALDVVKSQVQAMAIQVGAAVSGPLSEFVAAIQPIVGNIIAWIKANPQLVATVAKVTASVAAVSAAVYALGAALTFLMAHPVVLFAAGVAAAVWAIVEAYQWWADVCDRVARSLDGVEEAQYAVNQQAAAGGVSDPNAIAQAAAITAQAQAAVAAGEASIVQPTAEAAAVGQEFARFFEATAEATEKSAEFLQKIWQLMQSGRGGFMAGAG